MTTPDPGRATLTARLRAMADWLDAHPGIPLNPYSTVTVQYSTEDKGDINNIQHAALDTHFTRHVSDTADMLTYRIGDGQWGVEYRMYMGKPELCGSRPYPAGSEGDDGTVCVLPKNHAGDHGV